MTRLVVCLFTIGLAATALAQSKPETPLQALVAAERAFARESVESDTQTAFVKFFADDAVLFRPYPVDGKKWVAARPSPGLLTWDPSYARISAGGDLGLSTGPWEYRKTRDPKTPADAHGHFVSLWRKQPDGSWLVVFDHGTSHEAPASGVAPWMPPATPVANEKPLDVAKLDAARDALERADTGLSAAIVEKGSVAAFSEAMSEHARLYRENVAPVIGKKAALAALDGTRAPMAWQRDGMGVSITGDLAYTYGQAHAVGGASVDPAHVVYLRVWERAAGGPWRVVLDMVTPTPPPTP